MLYIIATPIGNLSDLTFRAVETLKICTYLLCEDTRHSQILLKHYNISKPLKSFHQFSEAAKQEEVLQDLKQGALIGLLSDAGTPGISDPGTPLVQACVQQGIRVVPIPGPSAALAALCCSGLQTDRFQFVGFLPRKAGQLKSCFQELLSYPGTTICYESPHRLIKALECLVELAPEHLITIARELTKTFEEVRSGTAREQLSYWKEKGVKGEVVLLISKEEEKSIEKGDAIDLREEVARLQEAEGLSCQEAIAKVAKRHGCSKRTVYQAVHCYNKKDF